MRNDIDRRRFLKVLGVTGGGTAALAGCSSDRAEKLIPYLVPPEDHIPGVATWYATTCRECPAGCGMHVRVRERRAVKVEGNPGHPVNGGRLCARGQASLQGLYNPDRVRQPMARNASGGLDPISWDDAVQQLAGRLAGVAGDQVRFLTGHSSGTFRALVREWLAAIGSPHHVVYEPFGYEALRHANRAIFGLDAIPRYDFAAARYVLSFGADFLETWISPTEHAAAFADGHAFRNGAMGRYVHVEPRMSMSGMSADEWIAPVPGTEALIALAMAHVIVRDRLTIAPTDVQQLRPLLDAHAPERVADRCGVAVETLERLAQEFAAALSVALAGGMGAQHGRAHVTAAAANVLNYVAGNVGRTVRFGAAVDAAAGSSYAALRELTDAMRGGVVGVLLVHGTNPAHAAPPGLGFSAAMENAAFKVSFAQFLDETASACDLILPDHDPLEQWNDAEPRAGVYGLQQPVMAPVFETRQTGDVLLQVAAQIGGSVGARFTTAGYKEYLQRSWQGLQGRLDDRRPFDTFWREGLQRGGVWTDPPREQAVRLAATATDALEGGAVWEGAGDGLTLVVYPSPALYDGRGANRPWLQELPDPVTKVTWSTWIEIHPATAADLGIAEGDHVEVTTAAGSITAPAFLYPGLRRDTVAVPIGQGHTAFGRYAEGRGANAYALLGAEPAAFGGVAHYASVTIRPTGTHERLAKASGRSRQLDRGIADAVTLAALTGGEQEPHHAAHAAPVPGHIEELLDHVAEAQHAETRRGNYVLPYTGTPDNRHPRWAMAIDLSKCTGCSACVTACHAENNIPAVGERLVRHGREMSWIRIERYFEGGEDDGHPFEARVVPMLCQQCGNAPCEPVCPVFAAYHTVDGLNAQVYNRCVGTRYCSNNCPYKVRYFNYFDHQNEADPTFAFPEPLDWQLNPDVTVRSKGVMEKCTFCVQRIRDAQHHARLSGDPIQDGDVVTACQQTCPSGAIVFGDLNDPESHVSRLSADERGYHVLESLNTRPAITYLKKVRNVVEG